MINIHISYNGLRDKGDNRFRFPYKALSPVTGQTKMFNTMDDVYEELENCYDEIIEKEVKAIGETLYAEHFFFCNTSELLDPKIQQRIKEYNFCKSFNCPPYPSLQETPARVVDDFLQIDNIVNTMKREKTNG